MTDKLLLTVGEAADRLGVGRSFFYQLIQRGEVQSLKLGRARRVPLRALDEFVTKRLEDDPSSTEDGHLSNNSLSSHRGRLGVTET